MRKRKTLVSRVVDRAVEEAEIKKEIEDLKRQRDVVAGTLDFYTRYYAGEFKEEPEVAPEDAGEGYGEDEVDDDWYDEETEEMNQ